MLVLNCFEAIIKCFVMSVRLFATDRRTFEPGEHSRAERAFAHIGRALAVGMSLLEVLVCVLQRMVYVDRSRIPLENSVASGA